jgi:hypothetical protein
MLVLPRQAGAGLSVTHAMDSYVAFYFYNNRLLPSVSSMLVYSSICSAYSAVNAMG